MNWASRPSGAVVVDPGEGKPNLNLMGSVWRRIEAVGDEFDEVRVVGVLELGNDHPGGSAELVITSTGFSPALSCTVESFAESYVRVDVAGEGVSERLSAALADLERKLG